MDRKLLAFVLATMTATAGVVVLLAGSASAAEWHNYEGTVFPGHAYGLMVPEDAKAIEFALGASSNASASFTIYDPEGDFVGHYDLGESPETVTVAKPLEGRYAVYVYEVVGGLDVRVNADDQPVLQLQKLALERVDLDITEVASPKALDAVMSVKLPAAPVFATLLYEGSVENLNANVASPKGTIVTITGETGTAFAPGVWSSLTGVRDFDASNLAASGAYKITAQADRFEGTMVLTALGIDLGAALPDPETPEKPTKLPIRADEAMLFALPEGHAVAFQAKAGELILADPDYLEHIADEEKDHHDDPDYNATPDSHGWYGRSVVSIYDPSDKLLGVFEIEGDEPYVVIELPADGEYVAYTHVASEDMLVAKLLGSAAAPQVRALKLVEERFAFEFDQQLLRGKEQAFTLKNAPIDMRILAGEGTAVAASFVVENEEDWVASSGRFIQAGREAAFSGEYTRVNPEAFQKGEHVLTAHGLAYRGEVEVVSISYTRAETLPEVETQKKVEKTEEKDEASPLPVPLPL